MPERLPRPGECWEQMPVDFLRADVATTPILDEASEDGSSIRRLDFRRLFTPAQFLEQTGSRRLSGSYKAARTTIIVTGIAANLTYFRPSFMTVLVVGSTLTMSPGIRTIFSA